MVKRQASLSDKFDVSVPRQLLSGTQAIVRLTFMQKVRDERAGLDTAGYITGAVLPVDGGMAMGL